MFLQARRAFLIGGPFSLVLDEDGTVVETEKFFRTLPEGTVFLVLPKGRTWYPVKVSLGHQVAFKGMVTKDIMRSVSKK